MTNQIQNLKIQPSEVRPPLSISLSEVRPATKETLHDAGIRGYTLLFAILVAVVVLSVAVFILGVSKKQYALAVAARESMYAIYAADSLMGCATYAVDNNVIASSSPPNTFNCDGDSHTFGSYNIPQATPTSQIPSNIDSSSNLGQSELIIVPLRNFSCASVVFTVGKPDSGPDQYPRTVIDVRGYNYCGPSGDDPFSGSTRTVERALRRTIVGIW